MDKEKWTTDLGENSTCTKCKKRLCDCKERHDGTWENPLPSYKKPEKKEDKIKAVYIIMYQREDTTDWRVLKINKFGKGNRPKLAIYLDREEAEKVEKDMKPMLGRGIYTRIDVQMFYNE